MSLGVKGLERYFSSPRYFSPYDGKRLKKIGSETRFFPKKCKEMHKNNKKRRNPNMSEDCCTTGCDVREGSCFQSSEKRESP